MTDDQQASFLQRAVTGAVDATVGRVEDRVVSSTKGVIDDLEPYLAEETVPRIIDELVPYLVEQVVPEVIAGLTERLPTETARRASRSVGRRSATRRRTSRERS